MNVASPPVLEWAKCYSCKEEPKNAVESVCCGEVWCWECMMCWLPSHCSLCGGSLSVNSFKPAKAIERLWNQLKREDGQEAQQRLQAEIRQPCPNGCGTMLLPEEVEEHENNSCVAEMCCPNGCCAMIKRMDFGSHIAANCPLTLIKCRYGCEEKIMRGDEHEHDTESQEKHIEALLSRVEALENQLASPRAQIVRSLHGVFHGPWLAFLVELAVVFLICVALEILLVLTFKQLPPLVSILAYPLASSVAVGTTTFFYFLYRAP